MASVVLSVVASVGVDRGQAGLGGAGQVVELRLQRDLAGDGGAGEAAACLTPAITDDGAPGSVTMTIRSPASSLASSLGSAV